MRPGRELSPDDGKLCWDRIQAYTFYCTRAIISFLRLLVEDDYSVFRSGLLNNSRPTVTDSFPKQQTKIDEVTRPQAYYYASTKFRPTFVYFSRAVETHFKKELGFLGFLKKNLKNLKSQVLGFLGFLFSSQNFYFFVSNSVNLFELIAVAIISFRNVKHSSA